MKDSEILNAKKVFWNVRGREHRVPADGERVSEAPSSRRLAARKWFRKEPKRELKRESKAKASDNKSERKANGQAKVKRKKHESKSEHKRERNANENTKVLCALISSLQAQVIMRV